MSRTTITPMLSSLQDHGYGCPNRQVRLRAVVLGGIKPMLVWILTASLLYVARAARELVVCDEEVVILDTYTITCLSVSLANAAFLRPGVVRFTKESPRCVPKCCQLGKRRQCRSHDKLYHSYSAPDPTCMSPHSKHPAGTAYALRKPIG
jgi:hypothetical protein